MANRQQHDRPRGECPREADVVPFATGRLTGAARTEFERHLAACAACSAIVRELGGVVTQIKALPPAPVTHDLAPAILQRIPDEAWARRRPAGWLLFDVPVWIRAAAAVVIVAGLVFAATRSAHGPSGEAPQVAAVRAPPAATIPTAAGSQVHLAIAKGLGWLASVQEEDGHWDPVKWGAPRQHAVGITALAVLAFSSEGEAVAANPAHIDAMRRGTRFLESQQDDAGRFGPAFSGTPYNHALATLALLREPQAERNAEWSDRCARAVAVIRDAQDAGGGWGYGYAPEASAINASVTVWQLQALLAAQAGGRPDMEETIDRGIVWLVNTVNGQGRMGYGRADDFPYGYETMTAAGLLCMLKSTPPTRQEVTVHKMLRVLLQSGGAAPESVDYCRSYFLARALDIAPNAESVKLAGLVRERLVALQNLAGGYAGSWSPDDRWGAGCGRVYATAISVLALHDRM